MSDNRGINGRNLARNTHPMGAPSLVYNVMVDPATILYTVKTALPYSLVLIDAWFHSTGAASGTVVPRKNAGSILSIITGASTVITRATSINAANSLIGPNDVVDVSTGSNAEGRLYLEFLKLDA